MLAHRVVEALGDPTRRAVWERLVRGPASVGELAAGLPVSRPAVSQHLRVLAAARLVAATPQGARRVYRATPDGVDALRAWLDDLQRFWDDALAAYARDPALQPDRPAEEPRDDP
ncbi:ArsR/SmtB family transcription factor [Vallicoccus soli]|uniref:ArsR family transcriptional regulator n=1 Tax=Vallicoccus soli TaxID=2339232 RepID=A0A3A3Z0N8_9ACTN|nr:metalloregulator ArsR/SmtB family transcription factor [Vallicoccus soli]RJK97820.1 ArsR family transcriptional regulator [Vallicoccus soli]